MRGAGQTRVSGVSEGKLQKQLETAQLEISFRAAKRSKGQSGERAGGQARGGAGGRPSPLPGAALLRQAAAFPPPVRRLPQPLQRRQQG